MKAAIEELLAGVAHVETDSYDSAMENVKTATSIMHGEFMFFWGFWGSLAL